MSLETLDALGVDAVGEVEGNTGIARVRIQGKHVGEFMDIIEFNNEGLATSHGGVIDGAVLMGHGRTIALIAT